jgi:hypothetical protein
MEYIHIPTYLVHILTTDRSGDHQSHQVKHLKENLIGKDACLINIDVKTILVLQVFVNKRKSP